MLWLRYFFVTNAINTAVPGQVLPKRLPRTGAVFGIMRQSAKLRNSVITPLLEPGEVERVESFFGEVGRAEGVKPRKKC
jgi:hypothetical protein